MTVSHAVDDQVVDDPAPLVRQEGVLGLAVADPVEIVGEHRLQERRGPRPFDMELAHVGHVECSRFRAHAHVLGDHALVLHGHLPAGERDHSRSRCDVPLVEGRPAQGGAHGRDNS